MGEHLPTRPQRRPDPRAWAAPCVSLLTCLWGVYLLSFSGLLGPSFQASSTCYSFPLPEVPADRCRALRHFQITSTCVRCFIFLLSTSSARRLGRAETGVLETELLCLWAIFSTLSWRKFNGIQIEVTALRKSLLLVKPRFSPINWSSSIDLFFHIGTR